MKRFKNVIFTLFLVATLFSVTSKELIKVNTTGHTTSEINTLFIDPEPGKV
jgi:hypothetical protein